MSGRIVRLQAENVKRLSAVDITPEDGPTVVVGGKNRQGKTSVLDSIWYAMGGADAIPSKPLRTGEKKGHATVTLDDGTVIARKFSRKKDSDDITTSLEVKRANGDIAPSPQKILDGLCANLAFDPLAFMRMKPKDQLESLRALVGIDFTELERDRAAAYNTRTGVNREVKAKEAELAACPLLTDAPKEEISVAALMDEASKLEEVNRQNDAGRRKAQSLADFAAIGASKVKQVEAEIERLKKGLEAAQAAYEEAKGQAAEAADMAGKLKDEDVTAVRTRIKESEGKNRAWRQNQQHAKLAEQLKQLEAKADELTKRIDAADAKKAETMAAAKFPVPGLAFDESGVVFNGVPLDQASAAELTDVSVAMGLATNPKLPVMLIRDGSLLDDEMLAVITKRAQEHKAQVWIERVGEGAECSVIIEDGHVKQAEDAQSVEEAAGQTT